MEVRDFMFPISSNFGLFTHGTLREAVSKLRKTKLNSLPVIDDKGKLIGLFTRSTFYDCMLNDVSIDAQIEQYYIREVIYFREDKRFSDLVELTHWLRTVQVGNTFVVDMENRPIGVITAVGAINELVDQTEYLNKELLNIMQKVPVGILATDKNGKITVASDYSTEILGGFPIGQNIGDFLTDLNIDFSPVMNGAWANPRKVEFNSHKVAASGIPIIRTNGKLKKAIFVLQDLTKMELVAHELEIVKELKNTLETVLEAAYEGVAILDENGNLTFVNNSFCDRLGKSREQLIGQNINKFVVIENDGLPLRVLEINAKPIVLSIVPYISRGVSKGKVIKIYEDIDKLQDVIRQVDLLNVQLTYYKNEFNKLNGTNYNINSLVTRNEHLLRMKDEAIRVARSNSTVLITGESGTGKELFAHSIHNASSRSREPFVKVNCSAIPSELAESELFGYEAGAFTGAAKPGKPGKFELANGGTIFLDEIGDMPILLQSKLLRVIQEKEVERVGSVKTRKVNVRVIAATNRNLKELIIQGKFREDLYFRLNVIGLQIPPLRERKEDIPILIEEFIRKYNKSLGKEISGITDSALEVLSNYSWPGNVRELENTIERILNYRENGHITVTDIPINVSGEKKEIGIAKENLSLNTIEHEAIQLALVEANGNKSQAAKLLGISRCKLYRRLNAKNDIC